jgi:FAD/FMN-containing dehydrogenase
MLLQAHPLPKVFKSSSYSFNDAAAVYDQLMTWACDVVPALPPFLEVMIQTTAHHRETGEPVPTRITMVGVAITDDEAEADRALDILRTCPVIDEADPRIEKTPTTIEERYRHSLRGDPEGYRYAADNIYADGPSEVIVPRMRKVFLHLPSPRTHTLWLAWGATRPYSADMALSMQGPIYVATYVLWDDPGRDEEMEAWPPARMRELSDISSGGQMNDENMLRNPQRYFSPEAYEKLERLRDHHDPKRRFASFLGDPFPN